MLYKMQNGYLFVVKMHPPNRILKLKMLKDGSYTRTFTHLAKNNDTSVQPNGAKWRLKFVTRTFPNVKIVKVR